MIETFTEAEQEEIINTFLNENHNEEDPDFKTVDGRLNAEAAEHEEQLNRIETKTYVPIKKAMLKFEEQVNNKREIDKYWYNYYRDKMSSKYGGVLHIHKNGNRYVCSKERLDQIDFNIMERPRNYYYCWHC